MSLNVTTEARENRQLAIHIEVPKERVEKELRKAATKVSAQYRIPGFRKGHAPYSVVVQQFGLANLYGEFVDDLGQELYKQAIEQEGIKPYGTASLEDIQFDPLVYKLVIPLDPEIKLGDYRAVRIEEEAATADDGQVDEQIKRMLEQRSAWQAVTRPSRYGDTMTIDVRSVIPATSESEEIVVLNESDWEVTPDEDNPMDPPGFDAALVGISTGESKEFTLAWPEDSRSVHAGKSAIFSVTVKEVTSWEVPELTDEIARELDPDLEGADDLREKIGKQLAEVDAARRENDFLTKALDAVVEISELDYPPVVIEDQMDSMMQEFERRLRQFGIESLDSYFSQIGQDKGEYRESMRDEATKVARRNLVLSEIVKAEQLAVSDEAIAKRLRRMFGTPKGEAEQSAMETLLQREDMRSYITNQLLIDKAIKRLSKIARGQEVPAPGESAPDEEPDADWDESSSEESTVSEESAASEAEAESEQPSA